MTSNTPRSADLHPGPGFRVSLDHPGVDETLIKGFLQFEVPDISDALNRLYAMNSAIACQTDPGHVLCGPVCTVRVFPGDNLMVHKVLDVARPGDVVVVDAHGECCSTAAIGDIICTKARHRGIAGFIVDGLVRDLPRIRELDFPIFARGTTAVGPLHRGPGEINYPVSCGGVVVNPGDVVSASASGVVVVPREAASQVLKRLESDLHRQRSYEASVQRGDFSNDWVDDLLAQSQCLITDGRPDD